MFPTRDEIFDIKKEKLDTSFLEYNCSWSKIEENIIYTIGSLKSGERIRVDIIGIEPRLDVFEVPAKIFYILKYEIAKLPLYFKTGTKIYYYGYNEGKKYTSFYFNNLSDREKFLKEIKNKHFLTAHDDGKRNYAGVVARERQISLSSWNSIKNFIELPNPPPIMWKKATPSNDIRYLQVSIDDIHELYDIMGGEEETIHPQTLTLVYDLETYANDPNVLPTHDNGEIILCGFAICKTEGKILHKGCLSRIPYESSNHEVIYVKSERELILKFASLFRLWKPEFVSGFNDFGYDWKFILEKARKHKALALFFWNATPGISLKIGEEPKYNEKERMKMALTLCNNVEGSIYSLSIKIDSGFNLEVCFPYIEGCTPLDTMIWFKKLHPKFPNTRLKTVLSHLNLDNKDPMDYLAMHYVFKSHFQEKEFEETGDFTISDVGKYCVIDAVRVQNILSKELYISNALALSTLSYLPPIYGFLRANGVKVRNMLHGFAYRMNIGTSEISRHNYGSKGKFPGAKVICPIKGIEKELPVTGLDFSSLYPSIIRAFNFSPEKFVKDKRLADKLIEEGKDLEHVKFKYGDSYVEGWFIRYKTKDEEGLYVRVLSTLAILRKKFKNIYKARKEHCEKLSEQRVSQNMIIEAELSCQAANTKQLGIKIFMNTFYPFYLLQLAGGVTSKGRENLVFVSDYCKAQGYKVLYGDTDSVYVACKPELFSHLPNILKDKNKIKNASERVKLAMDEMSILRDKLNIELKAFNKSNLLSLAYEEVLFPVVFLGKKKYYGFEHMRIPNFDNPSLFKRGIDIVKRGNTNYMMEFGKKLLEESLSFDVKESLYKFHQKKMHEFIDRLNHSNKGINAFTKV